MDLLVTTYYTDIVHDSLFVSFRRKVKNNRVMTCSIALAMEDLRNVKIIFHLSHGRLV